MATAPALVPKLRNYCSIPGNDRLSYPACSDQWTERSQWPRTGTLPAAG